jgi:hypothetical protein
VQITFEIPSGPLARFSDATEIPRRIPIAIPGRDEPIMARVLTYDVTPTALRVTVDLADRAVPPEHPLRHDGRGLTLVA